MRRVLGHSTVGRLPYLAARHAAHGPVDQGLLYEADMLGAEGSPYFHRYFTLAYA